MIFASIFVSKNAAPSGLLELGDSKSNVGMWQEHLVSICLFCSICLFVKYVCFALVVNFTIHARITWKVA